LIRYPSTSSWLRTGLPVGRGEVDTRTVYRYADRQYT
jgi:hypothetical protein